MIFRTPRCITYSEIPNYFARNAKRNAAHLTAPRKVNLITNPPGDDLKASPCSQHTCKKSGYTRAFWIIIIIIIRFFLRERQSVRSSLIKTSHSAVHVGSARSTEGKTHYKQQRTAFQFWEFRGAGFEEVVTSPALRAVTVESTKTAGVSEQNKEI